MTRAKKTIRPKNLKAGIEVYLEKDWPKDFHCKRYRELRESVANGVDMQSWAYLLDLLWEWKAIRPQKKKDVGRSGAKRLARIDRARRRILKASGKDYPTLADVSWNDVKGLFAVAMEVKKTKNDSPVLASKLCHFLLPGCFPVVDNDAVKIGRDSYEDFWRASKKDWAACRTKRKLRTILTKAMKGPPIAHYPWATKISELCRMGAQARC
ncbi:MAG: hypothetical protein KAI47_03830 [Deltaproteobacteria bacterium]|nr:hypothetical protein [Deltaproteobacteria bacterium]